MRIANRRWQLLLVPLLLLAAVAVATLVGAHGDSQLLTQEGDDPGALLADNRATLSVCVDRPDGVVSTDDVDSVQRALDVVAVREDYARFYPDQPEASEGCPPPTVALGTPLAGERPAGLAVRVRVEEEGLPSEHRAFVYILPGATYGATFGSEPFYRVPAEMACYGHVCGLVTSGIYVPESAGAETLEAALLKILGLLPVEPDPTPDPTDVEDRRRRELQP